MKNYFLPQRTGLEICHLEWPANVPTMVFSTYMCNFIQDEIYELKDVIQDIMTTSSLVPKRCTISPLAQLNSMVSSCTTNDKATTAGSMLVFDNNVGEDGLSSQSTVVSRLDSVPYIRTFVQYDGTFGAPD